LKKIIKVSLLFLSVPILFSGCIEEKASKVTPQSKDKNQTKITKKNIKTSENISSKTQNPQFNNNSTILDELALNIQTDTDIDYSESTESDTQTFEIEDNWVAFTKKDEILETAKEYLGVPYVWAANGPLAFDCSGYTRYVFKRNGITLPRYSGHQANVGLKVAFDELKEGDLVFFDTSKGFHKRVNHVGIYIGNNQFIHASSAGKRVMITSFSQKKFYKNRFLYGRRVIDDNTNFANYESSEKIRIN